MSPAGSSQRTRFFEDGVAIDAIHDAMRIAEEDQYPSESIRFDVREA